jgi:hypothetical protein
LIIDGLAVLGKSDINDEAGKVQEGIWAGFDLKNFI